MMDYAGRVAQADTYPKLLRLNAREHGGEIELLNDAGKGLSLTMKLPLRDQRLRMLPPAGAT